MSDEDTRDALLDFVQGEKGRSWGEGRFGWNLSTTVCRWEGISCDEDGSVISVDLANSGLSATIAPSIFKIKSLRRLQLSDNEMHGTVPSEFGLLPKLELIDLSFNGLRGPLPVLSIDALASVDMSHNTFTGSIPDVMLNRNTTNLNLSENQLIGSIPSSIGIANKLVTLDLSKNKLNGVIPDSLWTLEQLKFLHLDHNDLMGMLPTSFERTDMSLETIALHTNYLSGTIPAAFTFLPNLAILLLDDNKLTGAVPIALCESDVNGPSLGDDLAAFDKDPDTDDAVGVIDIGFTNDEENSNGDSDEDNGLFQGFNYGKRDLEQDEEPQDSSTNRNPKCDRIVCPAGYRSYKYTTQKQGASPCYKCGDDYSNPYLGAHHCLPTDERTLLDFIHFELVGPEWIGGANSWRDDAVETCDREGITCNKDGFVTRIDLGGMNLVGVLPQEIGFFRHLEHLDLSENLLSGTIPSSLHFPPLQTLDLRGNMLMGEVPTMLCKKHGVNGNGHNGILTCDAIVCAVGSANPIGFANLRSEHNKCFECVHGGEAVSYLGSTDCKLRPLSRDRPESEVSRNRSELSDPMRMLIISLGMFLFFGYCFFRGRAKDLKALDTKMTTTTTKQLAQDDNDEEDYDIQKRPRKQPPANRFDESAGSEETIEKDIIPEESSENGASGVVQYDEESLGCSGSYEISLVGGTCEDDSFSSSSGSYRDKNVKLSRSTLPGFPHGDDGEGLVALEAYSEEEHYSEGVPSALAATEWKAASSSFGGSLRCASQDHDYISSRKMCRTKRVSFAVPAKETALPLRRCRSTPSERATPLPPRDKNVVGWRWVSIWDVQLMK